MRMIYLSAAFFLLVRGSVNRHGKRGLELVSGRACGKSTGVHGTAASLYWYCDREVRKLEEGLE